MPRSQRQLLDEPADERSFLFYVPSQEVEPERPQKCKPSSIIFPQSQLLFAAYHQSGAEGERTMFQRESMKQYFISTLFLINEKKNGRGLACSENGRSPDRLGR